MAIVSSLVMVTSVENDCEPTGDDYEPRINHVGSGAMNVGRRHAPESMIVGLKGCSMASRTFN
jgi:hypothetical protein